MTYNGIVNATTGTNTTPGTSATTLSANTTLTSANAGQYITINTSGVTITLPAISSMTVGTGFVFLNSSSGNVTLAPNGSDTLGFTTLYPNGIVWLLCNSSTWYVMSSGMVSLSTAVMNTRVFTSTGNVTMLSTDNILIVNKTTGSATTVTLPASPFTGQSVTIKDGKGDAATNNITVAPASGNIDGVTSKVIVTAYASITTVYNGTQWNIV